jgi:hypothetical protein
MKPLALREWRYPRTYRTIFAKEPRGIYQADVMELYPLWNSIFDEYERNTKYRPKDFALVCIDIYSRYVWTLAMDRQDSASMAVAIDQIFNHMGPPKFLQGDKKIVDAFHKYLYHRYPRIGLVPTKPHETNKNAIVERVIRTLKNDLIQYLYVHPFPEKKEKLVGKEGYAEEYVELDTTSEILQRICTLRNNTIHRTIREKPVDVFDGRALNRQIITKKKYPQFNEKDLVFIKPLRERGALSIKIFRHDYNICIINKKEFDKYQIKSLYNHIHNKNITKKRWYKPYELRKITPQQTLEHLNSPLVKAYLYQVYETPDAVEDMKKYLQQQL